MSVPKSLYDFYLGSKSSLKGFRAAQFRRIDAPLVASRVSTGEAGETDLDLLKSASLVSVQGGMFQRDFDDNQKVARAFGVFNKYDKNLYPTPPRSTGSAISTGYYPVAKAESDSVSFIAYGAFSAGTYFNILHKITLGGGVVNIALPPALASNGFTTITGITLHKKYLFVSGQVAAAGFSCHRYDIVAGTWQDVSGTLTRYFTLRNLLYYITIDSTIGSCTNETAAGAATYTGITVCGSTAFEDAPRSAIEFNGAAYIAKADGIYRFDGSNAVRVLRLVTKELCEFNGAIYFFAGFWLYKFDGVTVTRLQFFGNQEIAGPAYGDSLSLAANSDYLFISTATLTSGYTTDDKVPATAAGLKRIYTYDGIGFLLFHESSESFGSGYNPALVTNYQRLYDIFGNVSGVSSQWETTEYSFNLAAVYTSGVVTAASRLEFTISEYDYGFPNVFKSLELIEPLYSDLITGDSLVVSYQYHDGKDWSSWVTAGTITSISANRLEIVDDTKKLYKRLRINCTLTPAVGSSAKLKGVSWRFTLEPRVRWRWNILVKAGGKQAQLMDRSGSIVADSANLLNNIIVQSIKAKVPQYLLAPDYALVKTGINAAAVSFILKGQPPIYKDPYDEYPLIAVLNASAVWEILRVSDVSYSSGSDETTITVLERGYLGITPGSISADAICHLCYKVKVTRPLNENTILDENTYAEQSNGSTQLQREFFIEVTEV